MAMQFRKFSRSMTHNVTTEYHITVRNVVFICSCWFGRIHTHFLGCQFTIWTAIHVIHRANGAYRSDKPSHQAQITGKQLFLTSLGIRTTLLAITRGSCPLDELNALPESAKSIARLSRPVKYKCLTAWWLRPQLGAQHRKVLRRAGNTSLNRMPSTQRDETENEFCVSGRCDTEEETPISPAPRVLCEAGLFSGRIAVCPLFYREQNGILHQAPEWCRV